MASAVDVMDVDSARGAARRRRERRLRQFLRHERLTVAMVLSEKKHHFSRGQRKDRSGGASCTTRPSSTATLSGLAVGATGVGPEAHHGQFCELAPTVQILDAPELKHIDMSVPEQVIVVPKILCPARISCAVLVATQMVEQLMEVPWISPSEVL